jgi:hypothetical protein
MLYEYIIAIFSWLNLHILNMRGAVNPGVLGSCSTGGQNAVKQRCAVLQRIAEGLKAPRRGFDTPDGVLYPCGVHPSNLAVLDSISKSYIY